MGPDGAGKPTTMRMLTGLLRPNAGTIEIIGQRLALHKLKGLWEKRRVDLVESTA